MTKSAFLKKYGITEEQFEGKEQIEGSLDLRSVKSIPEGFNPAVGGWLDLRSVTSIPEGFNPTVGGWLDLSYVTSIPEGFNPTVGGSLYLSSVTSIPEGFNPTVGGSLDLRSVTSIPEGFNPTVGGSLYLRSTTKHIGADVDTNFFWHKNNKRYAIIDDIFCEIISERNHVVNGEDYKIYSAKKVNIDKHFYVANCGKQYAHGEDLHKSIEDLQFKIASDKLKHEPILADTIITVNHYRAVTGACEMGCKDWMERNGINTPEIKAKDLLPLLQKTNTYGYESFEKLMQA